MAVPTVKTVLGEVDPSKLGRTLTHEHLSMRFDVAYTPAGPGEVPSCETMPFTLQNSGWIRQFPYAHKDNIILNDKSSEEAVLESVSAFASAGGGALVENSTVGLKRKSSFLREVSRQTGVHIVAGTGYYVGGAQSTETIEKVNLKISIDVSIHLIIT